MQRIDCSLELSATDLVGYLNCHHLSALDRAVAEGSIAKPKVWDPSLPVLWERGSAHEESYIRHLAQAGLDVVKVKGNGISPEAVSETFAAMKQGAHVIVQGVLSQQGWGGRIDVLRRVDGSASTLGGWSYEAVETKLARQTKAGAILQLCLYSDLLTEIQGLMPEHMYVVVPWSEFIPQRYRFADYAAYYRKVKRSLRSAMTNGGRQDTYPDPKEYCDICRWREVCDGRRRDDDHLSLVAGISKLQINELTQQGVATAEDLGRMPVPLTWKPARGSAEAYVRVREQARIQVEGRQTGRLCRELLPVEDGFGLARLPEPSIGDVFLDLEGDPFVGEHGLEYLFGYLAADEKGQLEYHCDWAFSRAEEKRAFEHFVDYVMRRWETYPDLHIYHYAPYEPAALKRLMGRYATREEEIDQMLRAGLFVDLYQVVRRGVRASVESYSIKRLEPFFEFEREIALGEADLALARLQASLELDDIPSGSEEILTVVGGYNKDDCRSAARLRDWLEGLRAQLVDDGVEITRPVPGDGAPTERINDWQIKINELVERLSGDVPLDPEERDGEQQARWILAHVLDWHRREEKAVWWEYFRLAELSAEDLLEERAGLAGLTFVGGAGGTAAAPVHRYKFPPQEAEFRGGEDLYSLGGDKFGKIQVISLDDCTVDIKKRKDSAQAHPQGVFAHTLVPAQVLKDSLVRIGEYTAEHGLLGHGRYQAARDLLYREKPRIDSQPLHRERETTVEAAVRLCRHLEPGILPIQGPPGAGKTFTGAQMICELVSLGKKVGITANSHKVIRNLIDATIKAADQRGIDLQCCHKVNEREEPQHRLSFTTKNEELFAAFGQGVSVGGGTAWLWAREDAAETIDVLFVDEAAQMSLANVLAVSQAAKTVVLIGDPQQLDQPMQGSHPDGTGVSAFDYLLAGEQTIPANRGLFLEESWRLHPDICSYTSELFYEGKLASKAGLAEQVIKATGPISGAGLRFLPIEHEGNQNCSPEEAQALGVLVNGILASNATWVDRDGQERPVTIDDIVIIAPYNAQVFEIQGHLPSGARVGTVDKFQGQEAPIAIYSTATSSHVDAPRGMEFLYSLNRLNVATSRAKCISVIAGSPKLLEVECRTPRQMQMANAFCRYVEMADWLATGDTA